MQKFVESRWLVNPDDFWPMYSTNIITQPVIPEVILTVHVASITLADNNFINAYLIRSVGDCPSVSSFQDRSGWWIFLRFLIVLTVLPNGWLDMQGHRVVRVWSFNQTMVNSSRTAGSRRNYQSQITFLLSRRGEVSELAVASWDN